MARLTVAVAFGIVVGLFAGVVYAAEEDEEIAAVEPVYATVRLTYYLESGVTYSGQRTYAGGTACSWNYPIGTRFRFEDGEVVVCNDRGMLGSSGWLDVWRRADIARKYGRYATVEVLP